MGTFKKTFAGILIIAVLVLFNVVGNYLDYKIDFTEDKMFTLSDGTLSMLQKIEEPVHLEFYFSRQVEDLPIFYKNYATRIEDLLGEYVAASNGKVTLEIIEPKPDSDEAVRAGKVGIRAQETPSGKSVYFGLAVKHLGKYKNIPFFRPEDEQFLEHTISKLIYAVQQFEKPILGLYSPEIAVNGGPPSSPQGRPTPQWMFVQQLELNFEIKQIAAPADINEDVDLLFVFHPAGVTPQMEFAIDQFLLSGRPTLVAVDPSSFVLRQTAAQSQYGFMRGPDLSAASSALPTLFKHYGIQYDVDRIVADLEYAETRGNLRIPVFIAPDKRRFDPAFMPIAELNELSFPEPGSLSLADDSSLTLDAFVQSSDQANLLSKQTIADAFAGSQPNPGALASRVTPSGDVYTLAGVFSGELTTAFPEGKPSTPEAEENAEQEKGEWLTESNEAVQLIVIADSDWLFDRFAFEVFNIFGQTMVQPLNDNFSLLANLTDFYSGSKDLLSIRGKRNTARGFEVVEAIQAKAQKRYEDAMAELDQELEQVATELQDLQAQANQGNSLTISADMQAAIAEFKNKQTELRNERRKIREKAREDVEREEMKLLLLNIAGVPCLVALFGFVFLFRRHLNK